MCHLSMRLQRYHHKCTKFEKICNEWVVKNVIGGNFIWGQKGNLIVDGWKWHFFLVACSLHVMLYGESKLLLTITINIWSFSPPSMDHQNLHGQIHLKALFLPFIPSWSFNSNTKAKLSLHFHYPLSLFLFMVAIASHSQL